MLPDSFERAILKSSIEIRNELMKILSGPRSGFQYAIPGTGKVVDKEKTLADGRVFHYRKLEGATMYTASAPEEAPAQRLGHLRNSYQYKVLGEGFDAAGYVGSDLDYSYYLEFGTSNMHKRPHLSRAFQQSKPNIMKNFQGLV